MEAETKKIILRLSAYFTQLNSSNNEMLILKKTHQLMIKQDFLLKTINENCIQTKELVNDDTIIFANSKNFIRFS